MEFRRISDTGMVSSAVGLGCQGFAGADGVAGRASTVRVVRHALNLGISLIVIADPYGGATERLVGEAVAGQSEEVLVATQGGCSVAGSGETIRVDGRPDNLKRACDASLGRLRLDHIGLYFLAKADPQVPVTDSVGAMAELVTAGKVRYIGLPALPRQLLRQAHAEHPITAVIGEYSLWRRHAEIEFLPAAQELGVGFLASSALGRGFLTGRITSPDQLRQPDKRRSDPRFERESLLRDRELLRTAEEIASRRDIGIARLALAWLLAQGGNIVPIPAARNPIHVEMNAAAVGLEFSAEERQQLAALFPPADEK
jgi:aryl-alcohol dehydrogenase-like predicted oxidoreductase